ncbi:MAG: tape measure protein [Armatimonadetes bacterium]|nr:tape measure protein [Armatimonadota bacterium]
MVAVTKFRIDVVVDPKQAIAGQKRVAKALDATEKEALDLRRALVQALSTRDQGTAVALQKVNATLERTELQAEIAAGRLRTIDASIEQGNLRRFNRGLDDSAKKAQRLKLVMRRLFAGIGIALVVRQLGQMSDSFLALQNRLRTIIPSQKELNSTFEKLVGIANLTRTEIGSVVQLYQRGSLAAKELGASQAELLLFTERVGKALAVQGGSAASSSGALLQLSQALSSGIVRAEEFNSILEGAFPIAQAAARGIDGFGGSVSKLRNAIIKGQITSEVFFRGFLKGSEETAEQFERTSSTIGGAFTVLGNNATVLVGKFNASTGAASAFTDSVRVIADNLPQAIFTVSALSTAIGVKYVVSAVAATAVTGKLNTALLLTAGRMALVTASFAAATVSVVILANKIQRFNSDMEEIGENLRNLEEDGEFLTNLGSSISSAQREINALNRTIAEQTERGIDSKNQLARIKELRAGIAAARIEIAGETAENNKSRLAQEKVTLAKEAAVSATKRQEELLKNIREPMEKFIQLQGDLNVLFEKGAISQEKLNDLLAAARPAARPTAQPKEKKAAEKDPFKTQLDSLRRMNEELRIQVEHTSTQRTGLLIELDLRRRGVKITEDVRDAISEQVLEQKKLNDELARQKRVENDLRKNRREAEKEDRRVERLKRQVDVLGQINEQMKELIALRQTEADLIPQIDQALEGLRLRQLDASNELADGFTRAFIRIKQEAADLAAVGEKVVSVFADRATDAILEFARTGKFSFREFATAILDDLLRIIVRLLVVRALSAVVGGVPLPIPGLNPGRAHGGTVQPGQAPFPVNEEGQELFVPNRTGTIVPNPASVQQEPPQINLTLITVESEEMIGEALASGKHDEVLIQRMGENKDRLNQATS